MTENKQLSVEEQTSCLLSQTQSASGSRGQLEQAAMKLSVNISFSPCIAKWNERHYYFPRFNVLPFGSPAGERGNNKVPLKPKAPGKHLFVLQPHRSI